MMIEDLYKTTDKLNKHIESMALNKVNIEFLRKQMDKALQDIENLKDALMTWAKSNDVPVGFMMQSLRISLVGALSGPDLFEICNILGKDVILKRINSAISFFNQKT